MASAFAWPRQGLIALVRAYRLLLKPWLGGACRFEPSCSAYALQALQTHGARRGAVLTGWRLLRCQPWCDGGCDPVPPTFTLRRASGGARGLVDPLLPRRGAFTGLLAGPDPQAADPMPPTRKLP